MGERLARVWQWETGGLKRCRWFVLRSEKMLGEVIPPIVGSLFS